MAQLPQTPDLAAQRAAMQKLVFLVGKWSGEARVLRNPDQWLDLHQTEEVQYKLDGLILTVEGIGRTKSEGVPLLNALGILSYEDETKTYRMRAFNDGRFLETEVKLSADDKQLTWGFTLGDIRTTSILRINETGEWTETHEIAIGSKPKKCLMNVTVRRQK